MITTRASFPHRTIFFQGNSLMVNDANWVAAYEFYVPRSVYTNLIASTSRLTCRIHAVGGRRQTTINSDMATQITPYAKQGDIVVLWEGTNDLGQGGLSAADAWNNVVTFLTTLPAGLKVVICTVIARDGSTDAADLMTRIGSYNTLVRNNAATYGYTVCDLGADAMFDARSDCSNATNYASDKVHLMTAGNNRVITLMTSAVQSVL